MQWLRDTLRGAGFLGMIGTDDNAGQPRDILYNPGLKRLGFWNDFHPWRVPVPTRSDFRRMVEANGLPLVISEPKAYSSTLAGNCCSDNRAEIKQMICAGEKEGATMYYHSTDGLLWPTVDFEWIPGEC